MHLSRSIPSSLATAAIVLASLSACSLHRTQAEGSGGEGAKADTETLPDSGPVYSEEQSPAPSSAQTGSNPAPREKKEVRAMKDRLYPGTAASGSGKPGVAADAAAAAPEPETAPVPKPRPNRAQAPIGMAAPSTLAAPSELYKSKLAELISRSVERRDFTRSENARDRDRCARCYPEQVPEPPSVPNTEEYAPIYENAYLDARANPLSTFSIDVDGAAYSNTRRFIQEGSLPPPDAVRIEEFVNYFDYDLPQPTGSDPFSITTEVAAAPWNASHKLVRIGLQGRRLETESLPPSNLVFLIDVSGSMGTPEKLPLLKDGFRMLVDQMRPQDRISLVVYAGAAGMVLPPTSGADKEAIFEALDRLDAGGSTAGGAGLMLAYQAAREGFLKGGNNRVILATDGDFNVGISDDAALVRLIEEKRKTGVFLSVLGFGTGNYKDSKMEQLADKGNGNYYYIDNINEARKVLVEKLAGTLYAIAKDVKLQVEFNPAAVKSYRLVGYENRMLAAEDFNDDRKDAGELGAGTSVTALYEIEPAAPARPKVDPLKYQDNGGSRRFWGFSRPRAEELLTVKFRYKQPNGSVSKLLTRVLKDKDAAWQDASEDFRFAAAAAGFGLLLRDSRYRGDLDFGMVAAMARGARGRDPKGRRAEFALLVDQAAALAGYGRVGYRGGYGGYGE